MKFPSVLIIPATYILLMSCSFNTNYRKNAYSNIENNYDVNNYQTILSELAKIYNGGKMDTFYEMLDTLDIVNCFIEDPGENWRIKRAPLICFDIFSDMDAVTYILIDSEGELLTVLLNTRLRRGTYFIYSFGVPIAGKKFDYSEDMAFSRIGFDQPLRILKGYWCNIKKE